MFSRRHPYLFSLLVFSSISAVTLLGMSLLFFIGSRSTDFEFGDKVGIIEVDGVIAEAEIVIRDLKKFREDESIKAIVIRINSPGGGVAPSQEIFREIRKTADSKKIIASMGSIAASGGYYIAAGTNGIIASPGSITGSIGVIMGFTNFQELLKKIGLVPVVVKSGEFKDIGSPVREMQETEREILQKFVNNIHRQFVAAVVEGRGMDPATVEKLADGRIFTGEEAQALGLVDRLGNLEDAVQWAGRLAGIEGKIDTVYAREKKFPYLEYILDNSLRKILYRTIESDLTAEYLYKP
ncbi:signal peptide peptidase SppA [Thermodesulfobacteriota bacterium]